MRDDQRMSQVQNQRQGEEISRGKTEQGGLVQQIYTYMRQEDKPQEERMQFVQECLEGYDALPSKSTKSYFLQLLADIVLHEELTDRNSYKMTHQEYPILSRWQQEYRQRKEYSIKLAEEYAADGKWYKKNIS